MCDVMTGSDNSSGKKGGTSLHVDLCSDVWKPTDRVKVLLNLWIDQCSRSRRDRVNISIKQRPRSGLLGLEDSRSEFKLRFCIELYS